ncbi:MAG: hypothetical protein HYX32_01235 [Actinobacteria bacterium]|nr:hypothetical protein [Actinomycetota bacterium]
MVTRKAIHAYLSPEAHDAWHDFAAENGVSVSGLIEAVAQDWAQGEGAGDTESDTAERLAKLARKIDAQRRRRSRS